MKQSSIVSEKPSIVWANNMLLDEDRLDSNFYDVKYIDKQSKLLDSDIPKIKLKDLITSMNAPIGWQGIPSTAYRERGKGIPLIRIQNIKDNQVEFESVIDVDPQIYIEQPAIQAEKNDIIITRVGTIGRLCKVPSNINKVAMGQNLTRVSFNSDLVDVDFILAYMNTDYCLNQMIRFAYGGVQPSLTNKNIKDILIIIPKYEVQYYIGSKVREAEKLREEAKKLKEEAEFIFNQNVGNLVSVKRMVKKVNEVELNNDTWFPAFYDSLEIGKNSSLQFIPFIKIQKTIKCGDPVKKEDREGSTYPFYGASGITDSINRFNFDGNYLVIAQDGTIGSVSVSEGKFWANNHVWVVEIKSEWNMSFLKMYLEKYPYWYSLTTGSVIPKITSENLKKILIPKIDKKIQDDIGNKLEEASKKLIEANTLIQQAKLDVDCLIEGNFDETIINNEQ